MTRLRRHPDGESLSAWYDGEVVDPRLSAHVDGCERCWATVRRFVDVDEVVRSGTSPRAAVRSWSRMGSVATTLAVGAVAVVVVAAPGDQQRSPQRVAGTRASSTVAPVSAEPVDPPYVQPPPDLGVAGGTSAPSSGPPAAAPGVDAPRRLRLGVPLPGGDPRSSSLAAEVWHAAQVAVAGSDGVEVVAVTAGDQVPAGIDAVVGGWSAVAPVLVQTADGLIVAADPDAERAGERLVAEVGDAELIGVIRGSGPDAAFGDGVAAARRVVSVDLAPESSCDREVRSVLARGAAAIALAVPPPAARTCIAAVEAGGARPRRGILVPPSMTLEPESPRAAGLDVLGLAGLPMPTSDTPGAARFRDLTGARSYRAMLTFAGVELAVALDAAGPDVASAWRREATWHSDLVTYERGRNLGIHVVRASGGGWERHWDGDATFGDRGG